MTVRTHPAERRTEVQEQRPVPSPVLPRGVRLGAVDELLRTRRQTPFDRPINRARGEGGARPLTHPRPPRCPTPHQRAAAPRRRSPATDHTAPPADAPAPKAAPARPADASRQRSADAPPASPTAPPRPPDSAAPERCCTATQPIPSRTLSSQPRPGVQQTPDQLMQPRLILHNEAR